MVCLEERKGSSIGVALFTVHPFCIHAHHTRKIYSNFSHGILKRVLGDLELRVSLVQRAWESSSCLSHLRVNTEGQLKKIRNNLKCHQAHLGVDLVRLNHSSSLDVRLVKIMGHLSLSTIWSDRLQGRFSRRENFANDLCGFHSFISLEETGKKNWRPLKVESWGEACFLPSLSLPAMESPMGQDDKFVVSVGMF